MQRISGNRNRQDLADRLNFGAGDMEFARQLQQQQHQQQQQQQQQQQRSVMHHQSGWPSDEFLSPMLLNNAVGTINSNYGAGNANDRSLAPLSNDYMAMDMRSMGSPYIFKCPDCAFMKSSCEDLEIHIKTEHLNWLPFECPFCHQNRASDSQMREHIHSVHKKPENKYMYVDNVVAKRMLQEMIDRALFSASVASLSASARSRFNNNANRTANNNLRQMAQQGAGSMNCNGMFPSPFISGHQSSNYFLNNNDNIHSTNSNNSISPLRKQTRIPSTNSIQRNVTNSDDSVNRRSNNSANTSGDECAENCNTSAGVTVLTKKTSNSDDLLAQLQQQLAYSKNKNCAVNSETEEAEDGERNYNFGDDIENNDNREDETLDDETSAQLSHIFGSHGMLKSEFDMTINETNGNVNNVSDLNDLTFPSGRNTLDMSNTSVNNDIDYLTSNISPKSHQEVLQNLSAIFSAAKANAPFSSGASNSIDDQTKLLFDGSQSPIRLNHNNNPIRKRAPRGCGSNQSISKKRVLGECASCHKPITAGARQMHMFYHLGKDHNTYRFRCKHENCDIEHYRKDQMENHHSKVHGKIEAEMMEDRSLELYDMCQKMSMELLGTVGNTPGPTAAQAQIAYDNMQRDAELSALRKKKRNRTSGSHSSNIQQSGSNNRLIMQYDSNINNNNNISNNSIISNNEKSIQNGDNFDFIRHIQQQLNQQKANANTKNNKCFNINSGASLYSKNVNTISNNNSKNNIVNIGHNIRNTINSGQKTNVQLIETRYEETIECQMCHKVIVGRTRGFHILWHLNTDLGIVRYACRYCDFKHDRPQSVSTHGKKEHNDEDCVHDLISNFGDEVKSMSKACFGREQLFAKEERRRNKIERSERALAEAEQELSDMGNSEKSTTIINSEEDDDIISENSYAINRDKPSVEPSLHIKISLPKSNDEFQHELNRSSSSTAIGSSSASSKRKSTRRFGTRRQKSRKQREEMAKLREVSMRLGGAQYFKKKSSESILCEKCGVYKATRLSQHAYSHLEDCDLFLCPQCNLGHCIRDIIVKHLKDFHNSVEPPTDNRLKYAREIKEAIRECFPSCFIDAPIPTQADIERLKANLKLSDKALATFDCENEPEIEENENEHEIEENENEHEIEENENEEDIADEEIVEDEEYSRQTTEHSKLKLEETSSKATDQNEQSEKLIKENSDSEMYDDTFERSPIQSSSEIFNNDLLSGPKSNIGLENEDEDEDEQKSTLKN